MVEDSVAVEQVGADYKHRPKRADFLGHRAMASLEATNWIIVLANIILLWCSKPASSCELDLHASSQKAVTTCINSEQNSSSQYVEALVFTGISSSYTGNLDSLSKEKICMKEFHLPLSISSEIKNSRRAIVRFETKGFLNFFIRSVEMTVVSIQESSVLFEGTSGRNPFRIQFELPRFETAFVSQGLNYIEDSFFCFREVIRQ